MTYNKKIILVLVFLLALPVALGYSTDPSDYVVFDSGDLALNGSHPSTSEDLGQYGWSAWTGDEPYYSNAGNKLGNLSIAGDGTGDDDTQYTVAGSGNLTFNMMMYDPLGSGNGISKMLIRTDFAHQLGIFEDQSDTNYYGYDGGFYDTGVSRTSGWHNFTISFLGTNVVSYIDGVVVRNSTQNLAFQQIALYFNGEASDMPKDNIMVWNGTFDDFPQDLSNPISLTIYKPVDNNVNNTANTKFEYNASDSSANIDTVLLYTNSSGSWQINATNTTYTKDTISNFILTLPEGSTNWGIVVNDTNGYEAAINRTIFVDLTNPTVNTFLPVNDSVQVDKITYTVNASDTNLYVVNLTNSCGYSYSSGTLSGTEYYNSSLTQQLNGCSLGNQNSTITVCDGGSSVLNCNTLTYDFENVGRLNVTGTNISSGGSISNFDVYVNGVLNGSTSSGFYHVDGLRSGLYNITFDSPEYQLLNATVNMSSAYQTYNFNVYTTNSIQFFLKDEVTQELISGVNGTATLEFVSDNFVYNYTITNGSLYVDLISPATYTLRYSSPTYYGDTRFYYFQLNNRSTNNITLFLLNDTLSTDTTTTTYDQVTLNTIEGAVVYVMRYYQLENTYKTVAMYESDVSGKSYFQLQQNSEYYKFLVDYPFNTLKLETNPLYVQATSINLYINLQDAIAETFFQEEGINLQITHDEVNKFTATYTDSGGVASQYCLTVKQDSRYSKTQLNQTCSTSNTGSLEAQHPTTDGLYYAVFTAVIDGESRVIGTGWQTLDSDELDAGQFGIFLAIILIMTIAFLSQISYLSVIFVSGGLVFSKLLGLLPMDWGYIISVFIMSIVLIIILEMKK